MKETISSKQAKIVVERKGSKEAILLLHAGIADKRMWENEVNLLSKDYCVIAVDLPGFGESKILGNRINYVEIIEIVLDHYELTEVTIIAASFGGKIAIDFCLIHPKKVKKMILISPAVSGWEDSKELIDYEKQENLTTDVRDLVTLNYEFWITRGRDTTNINIEAEKLIKEMLQHNFLLEDNEAEEINIIDNSLKELENIHQPLLIINGERDISDFLAIGSFIHNKVQFSQREVIPNTAHLPNLENSKLVSWYITEFLKESD